MKANHHKKRICSLAGILFILLLLMAGQTAIASQITQEDEKESVDVEVPESDYHTIVYDNKKYVYNPQITAVLYAGVDSSSELVTYNRYTIAPRADSVELIVLDNYHKTIKILAISRDTITAVERYTMNGSSRGTYDTHLGYAYSYGDGGKISCTNLTQTVSWLLGGVPIHEYAVTNNASVAALNQMVGGVCVTVPNDDLISEYPELKKGAVVTLDDTNADAFVRWRDISIPFSNNGRMERQQSFSMAFLQKFKQELSKDTEGVWKKIESMSPYIETSITKNQYLSLSELVTDLSFSKEDYYYIAGEDIQGEQYDEFYPDKESLEKTIIDLFYIEDGEVE